MAQIIDPNAAGHQRSAAVTAVVVDVIQQLRDLYEIGGAPASDYREVLLDGLRALDATTG